MFTLNLMHTAAVYQKDRRELGRVMEPMLFLLRQKSHRLYSHSIQVAHYSASIAAQMGLPATEIETIQSAALLHDIGLLTLPTVALHKMPFLTRREQALYKKHPDLGSNMLEMIPACQHIIPYIRHHHERWDGTGFPKHLRGVNIPLGARIIAVADYYEQITNPSAENWAKTKQEALNELFSASGLLFDPSIVRVFIDILS